MEEEGVVVEVLGETATVRIEEHGGETGGCEGCRAEGTCKLGEGGRIVEADNAVGAMPGQRVVIKVEPGAFLKASFLVYMMPVIMLFAGAVIGGEVGPGISGSLSVDVWQALFGVVFLAVSFAGVRLYDRKVKGRTWLRPLILRVVDGGVCPPGGGKMT